MSSFILTSFVVMGVVLSVITLHSAWLLTKAKNTVVTWIYPAVVVVVFTLAVMGVQEIQGYPIDAKPTGEWEYLTHYEEGVSVLVLLKERGESRTYRFIPTQEEKKAMEQAKEAKDKGARPQLQIDAPLPKMELIRLDEEHPK